MKFGRGDEHVSTVEENKAQNTETARESAKRKHLVSTVMMFLSESSEH